MSDVRAAANLIEAFAANIVEWPDTDLGGHAIAYAHNGWPVLPLHPWDCRCCRGRVPCATNPEPRGKAPLTTHGADDATTDLNLVAGWWERWPTANIGLRIPAGVVVVDIDPRNGGTATWATLHERHDETPTRTAVSGRGDGGRHLYYGHPGGKLGKLGAGLDLKKAGYVVAPPSIHTQTGNPYRWVDAVAPLSPFPAHLLEVARPKPVKPTATSTRTYDGDSIADWYTAHHTWGDILTPHGWHLVYGNGDDDGSAWRHPSASHAISATVKYGCLFVYSTSTDFDATDDEEPHGYTRFRAFAVLEHRGDLSAAARAAVELRGAA